MVYIINLKFVIRDHIIRTTPTHTTDDMVFGEFIDNNSPRDEASRLQALRAANCIKILGKGVIRVVHRVDDARENNNLGKFVFHQNYENISNFLLKFYEKNY